MKQWQEIEGGWSVQWITDKADSAANPGRIPSRLTLASFPSAWSGSGEYPFSVRYFATVPMDKGYAAGALLLRVAGANGPMRVWANGQLIGQPLSPWVPATIDLSAHAVLGKPVVLCLEVQAPTPGKTQTWAAGESEALAIGPILYDVPKLLSLQGTILSECIVRPDFSTDRVRLSFTFLNAKGATTSLGIRLTSPDGQKAELKRDLVLPTENALHELEFEVPDPKAWVPDHPAQYLFDITVDGGQTLRIPFGFSSWVWNEKGIHLNEHPLFIRGVRWDAAGPVGFLSNPNPKTEFNRMKEAGFNAIFPCSAPMPESLLLLAQSQGMVVLQNLGVGACADNPVILENALHTSCAMVLRQENLANVVAFVGADLPGPLLESNESEWLKQILTLRADVLPKGLKKDLVRTIAAHLGGTRLEIGKNPTLDPVPASCVGGKGISQLEAHRFRLPAPVSIQRQSFLARHLHPKDPSDLVDQGLGDHLFWKKLHKGKAGGTKFFAARLGCPSMLDAEATLEALGNEKGPRADALNKLNVLLEEQLALMGLSEVWTGSHFASSCQQVGGLAVLRQADALTINPRCCGILVNQWSDTPQHASGLVGLAGQPKPGFELFRKYHKPVRVIAEAMVRTPYIMQSAAIRIHMSNEGVPGEFSLLLRVKGNNGRIWHQESLPAVSEGGVSSMGKFEFPVGDERGSFTFDMQLSRQGRDVFRTEETFYVPPAVNLETAAQTFRFLGEFPEEVMKFSQDNARAVLVNQVKTFDPSRLTELLDDAVGGLTVVFAGLDPDDARFLQKHGALGYPIELHPAASAGGEGYHWVGQSPLFARLPQGLVAGEVYADLLPAWSMVRIPQSQVMAGLSQLQAGSSQWIFRADIQSVPHGKGRVIFHQYRIWEKLGTSALADALFANLADVLRESA